MNLIDMNDKLLVNKNRKLVKVPDVNQDMCDEFRRLIRAAGPVQGMYDSIEESSAFLTMYPGIRKIYGQDTATELFYACKLGFHYPGVPCRLVYILNKLFKEFGVVHVNDSLSRAVKLISPFVDDLYESNGVEVTVKDVVENFVGAPIKLLTSSVRKVKATDCSEVYVPNVERVALLPADIANVLPYAECAKILFDRDKGLVIGDVIVRCMNNRLGVTKDDFDLRSCM